MLLSHSLEANTLYLPVDQVLNISTDSLEDIIKCLSGQSNLVISFHLYIMLWEFETACLLVLRRECNFYFFIKFADSSSICSYIVEVNGQRLPQYPFYPMINRTFSIRQLAKLPVCGTNALSCRGRRVVISYEVRSTMPLPPSQTTKASPTSRL